MTQVRAFQSYGQCKSCHWVGGLDDGLCVLHWNLAPDVYATVEEASFGERPDLPEHDCVACGRVIATFNELCGKCKAAA